MIIKSLQFTGLEPHLVQVEISLIPGLPNLQILDPEGLTLRASGTRIKTALINQGFHWPKSKQIIVNLRGCRQKSEDSSSLELAIAVGVLQISQQLELDIINRIYCGELSLTGEVHPPLQIRHLNTAPWGPLVVSGSPSPGWQIDNLRGLSQPRIGQRLPQMKMEKPLIPDIEFPQHVAKILAIIATGEHSAMIAGPPGSGKSTFAEALYYVLQEGPSSTMAEAQKWWALSGQELLWRPKVFPHHSTSPLAMIGGGYPPTPGEITRAHGGLLFLDEYLEFPTRVQEALREPMERGEIRIARKGQVRVFPADSLVLAATNLCVCGNLTPNTVSHCRLSLNRCKSHLERLNGPMLDRFTMLSFSDSWKGQRNQSLQKINIQVEEAVAWRKKRGQQIPNNKLSLKDIFLRLSNLGKARLPEALTSERRRQALLRVSQTLADLDQATEIQPKHVDEAEKYCIKPFFQLTQIFS
ncbi:MAG: ATP-binding protein [Bdellovibrionales bacterium]|nr:ATP-binding protein [Bdellovibrionales bacterium]